MIRVFQGLVIIALLTIIGCSNSNDDIKTDTAYFTGVIKEIDGNSGLVSAKIFEDNPEGDVLVDLSVNTNQEFQEGDKIKVGFDGNVMESYPAQINTLSVELVDR